MAEELLVPLHRFIRYDGTNWSEIEPLAGGPSNVTDLGDGVKQWQGGGDPVIVNPGDWYNLYPGSGFMSASVVAENYRRPGLDTFE